MSQQSQMISQTQIKRLQQTINKQLQSSPLHKKMKASQIYQQMNQKSSKSNAIIQTSSNAPQNLANKSAKKIKTPQKVQEKKQKIQQSVMSTKSTQQKKVQQRQFLITQNKQLKQQTLALIEQLQVILNQTKQKKYGIDLGDDSQSKELQIKKAVIARQLAKITQLQTTIAFEKRQLKNVHDDESVIAQEAQIKILQAELQKLEKQKKAITNILKSQGKAIQQVQMTPEFREKFNRTKDQLQKIKEECKVLQIKTLQNEKLLKKKHEKVVGHHTKIKKIQKMLKEKEEKKKKAGDKFVTIEMMAEVQDQIAQLQSQKAMTQKSWMTKISNIESELETRKLEQQRKMLILKDKEKEVRLNDLRIKELKKLAMSQAIQRKKASLSDNQNKKDTSPQGPLGRVRNIIRIDNSNRQ